MTQVVLEPGGTGGSFGAPWSNGDVLLSDERALYRLTVATGTATHLIDLSGRHLAKIIPGDPPQVVTRTTHATQTAYEVVVLDGSPEWAPIAKVPLYKYGGIVVPAGKDWFIVHDGSLDSPDRVDVWHVTGGSAGYVGSGDRMLLDLTWVGANDVSPEGRWTLPHCEKRECSLLALDLMVPALTQTAHVDVPEDVLSISSFRRTACSGADMIVGGYDHGDPDGVSNFYSVQLH